MPVLSLKNVSKSFGSLKVTDDVSFNAGLLTQSILITGNDYKNLVKNEYQPISS